MNYLSTKLVSVKAIKGAVLHSTPEIKRLAHSILKVRGVMTTIKVKRTSPKEYSLIQDEYNQKLYSAVMMANQINPEAIETIQCTVCSDPGWKEYYQDDLNESDVLEQMEALKALQNNGSSDPQMSKEELKARLIAMINDM